jgi:hypothetical protein
MDGMQEKRKRVFYEWHVGKGMLDELYGNREVEE